MRRSRRVTSEELEQRVQRANNDAHCSAMMLRAHIAGETRHVPGKTGYRAYIAEPESATGGYVAVVWDPDGQRASVDAYYAESWSEEILRELSYAITYPLTLALRELASKVRSELTRWRQEGESRDE